MTHYVEIYLLNDPEFSINQLMENLFAKAHRVLVENGRGEIGISFPQAGKTLGNTMRLHGGDNSLERIMRTGAFQCLSDYVRLSAIMPTPETCQHRQVKRVQVKSSPERLYRRSVRRGLLTETEAALKIKKTKAHRMKHPFVHVYSHSTGKKFRLFINQDKLLNEPKKGRFSHYGLSEGATVPWF